SILIDSLGINDEQTLDIPVVIPQGFTGQIFFKGSLDESNIQPELFEGNNVWFSVYGGPGPGGTGGSPIGSGTGSTPSDPFVAGVAVAPGPQLDGRIQSITTSGPATSGFSTVIRIKVEPISPLISLPIVANVRLSLVDPTNSSIFISRQNIPVLISDTSTQEVQGSLEFPPHIQGPYTFKAILDLGAQQFRDSDVANNTIIQSINLVRPALPDLVILSTEVPTGIQSGGFFSIPVVVKNQGPGILQTSDQQRAYLSNSPSGTFPFATIGTGIDFSSINPGETREDTIRGFIPSNVSGNFFLVIKADANNENFEGEAGELNNLKVEGILINPPPPIDLVPESVTLPASFTLGKNVNGSLICRNL
ncbi:MAG TPA: CARDB domain-containing protein, partial [Catalimonadaceae bacterium]|nr:CARDB domain-containing protein [Catalimonadaceae bacterium]